MKFINTWVLPLIICMVGLLSVLIFTYTNSLVVAVLALIPATIIVTGPLFKYWSDYFNGLYELYEEEDDE